MEHAPPWPAGWLKTEPRAADRAVVARVAAGDRRALAELYAQYQRPLFQYLLQLTPDHSTAEELLQDTFLAAWKSARQFEGRSSVLTWLVGIARRQAHNVLRRAALPRAGEDALLDLPAPDPPPEAAALASADRRQLAAALERLSPLHREVLVLTFVHGLSYAEIAGVLGVPIGTVKSRLSNAKQALRALFTETRVHPN